MGSQVAVEFRGGPDVIVENALATIAEDQWDSLKGVLVDAGFIEEDVECNSIEDAKLLVQSMEQEDVQELARQIEAKELVL